MKTRRRSLLLLLPCAAALALLFVMPQLLLFEVSLSRRSAYGGVVHAWSAGNYARALEPLYLGIVGRSLALAVVTTLACLLLGYPLAYWIALRARPAWRNVLLALVVLPFWTSFLVRMYAWMVLLRPVHLLYTDAAVLLGQIYGELPFMILPLYASLEKLDRSLLEAAADLGAGPARALWTVTIPLTRPGVLAGSLLVFVASLGAYLAPDLLGGARTAYLANLIQSQFAVARDMPFGSALSFLLSAAVLALLLPFRRVLLETRAG